MRLENVEALMHRLMILATLTALAVVGLSTLADAEEARTAAARRVTGLTPLFPADPPVGCGSPMSHRGWEFQPQLVSNPADPDHLAAVWIQDWSDAPGVATSTDGGETWRHEVLNTTPCTWRLNGKEAPEGYPRDPEKNSTNDPSVAVGPDGVVYVLSNVSAGPVVVHRSPDGGRTWLGPTELDPASPTVNRDRTSIVADPHNSGRVYALWEDTDLSTGLRQRLVRRSTDGGTSWSQTARIPSTIPSAGSLFPLPDGTVADVSVEIPLPYGGFLVHAVIGPQPQPVPNPGPTTVQLRVSPDGLDWSAAPILVAVADPSATVLASAAASATGEIYVFWLDVDESGFTPMFTHASQPYTHWPDPLPAGPRVTGRPTTGANDLVVGANPAIGQSGDIAFTFYDHRNDPGNSPPEVTDYWIRHSHDGGLTWREDHVAGPFNKSSAPDGKSSLKDSISSDDFDGPGGLGEGQGFAAAGRHFVTLFTVAEPLPGSGLQLMPPPPGQHNPTDLFFLRLRPGTSD